jgi:hypothetical protein
VDKKIAEKYRKKNLRTRLEMIIERDGLSDVIEEIVNICHIKAHEIHMDANQDDDEGRMWYNNGRKLGNVMLDDLDD